MIGTTTPRTSGDLSVLGREPASRAREIKARLGVVPQEDTLDTELLDFVQLAERREARPCRATVGDPVLAAAARRAPRLALTLISQVGEELVGRVP